ncbi:MAG TPA: Rid family hydrolase, partial [Bryobacteraceae bacterium]|nr:Rid family hydrolase [Bryobacteraceae bacterium]
MAALLLTLLALDSQAQPRKIKKDKPQPDPVTQSLPELKDPPPAAAGETARLVFRVSPLNPKGLLTQQVHEALKSITQENRGAAIVKLRAFVAGSGDLRRVQTIVSEFFTDRKQDIPALSTIQVGALPMEGAQVVLESIAAEKGEKKSVNPNGLAFFSGQQAKDLKQSLSQLRSAVDSAGLKPAAVLRATCYLNDLDTSTGAKIAIATAFPAAAVDFVQQQRLALDAVAECEAVARLDKPPASPVQFLNPPALARNPNYSQIVLVNAPRIVFSGTQMAFGEADQDVRLSFERLRKAL